MRLIKICSLSLGIILLGVGCLNLGGGNTTTPSTMNEMDYFNKYVEELNKTSRKIEELHNNYENTVPLEVKAEDEINLDISDKAEGDAALSALKTALLNSNLKIDDSVKQTALEALLAEYASKYVVYLQKYQEVGTYYVNKTYQTDLAKAADYETQIQQAYADYQTAEKNIFDKIEEYQKTSSYKASLSSTEPIERLNASIDYLTDGTEDLYNAYMEDWDVNSEPTKVQEKYDVLAANKATTVANLEALDYSDVQIKPVKDYFDENYKTSLDNLLADFEKLLNDYNQGLVSAENIDTYDISIQEDYEKVIEHHNEIINLTNEALSTQE